MKKSVLFLALTLFSFTIIFSQNAVTIKKISSKGDPIFFFPHIGCSSEMWKEVAENLASKNSIYLVDLAGFNGSEPIQDNFTATYLTEVVNYINKNKLKRITFIGQNYGAFLAYQVANSIPKKTKAFIGSDFYPKLSMILGNPDQEKLNQFITSLRDMTLKTDETTFTNNQKQIALSMNFIDTTYVNKFVAWQKKSDRNTLAETLVEQLKGDLIPMFEKNEIPTLVFNTWYFAKNYKKMELSEAEPMMQSMFPNAQNVTHKVTEEAKDFIANDQPEWFVTEVNQFLKDK
ncbi:MAG: hypothetical protein CMP76_06345 [Flavobacterium sp.]|uniref:alpha/beta fold hydrolase n=1 Tax=Flavobacterium sp. TaxID=239 RepID=UPI000C369BE2|nr:alpha/beta fold hydrolase [Flavobacterium sp.]MBF02899.1 hypothetical protein [Flavobacterium sp.]